MSASGEIPIESNPEISDSAETSSSSRVPSTNDRSVSTTVRVKEGEIITDSVSNMKFLQCPF